MKKSEQCETLPEFEKLKTGLRRCKICGREWTGITPKCRGKAAIRNKLKRFFRY